jgi:hypothetical protein
LRVSAGISPDYPHHLACSGVLAEVTFPHAGIGVNIRDDAGSRPARLGCGISFGVDRGIR